MAATPRNLHYGQFYGLRPLPDDGRPVLLVHGNCQAEALRVLIDADRGEADVVTVRMPPVHELTSSDVGRLHALLARADILVTHPVRAGYRDLPVGTAELRALMRPSARTLVVPIVRYAGLHPYQAIVRHPREPAAVPDVVPYHDLRIVAALAAGVVPDAQVLGQHGEPAVLREAAQQSLAELRRRENRCDVAVSDLIPDLGASAVHTINHPGNELLTGFASRIRAAAGLPAAVTDPGRLLLGAIRAPVHPAVISALGLDPASSTGPATWLRDGVVVSDEQIVAGHIEWYARHPGFVESGLDRHAERLRLLGL